MELEVLEAGVEYYGRMQYFRHVLNICEAFLKENLNHPVASFWKAFALSSEGHYTEAIRVLSPLHGKAEMNLAVTAALLTTHSQCQNKDRQAIKQLNSQLRKDKQTESHDELVFSGRFFWLSGKAKQARWCAERVLNTNKKHVGALALWGWLNMKANVGKSMAFFQATINLSGKRSISGLLGLARCHELNRKYDRVLDSLNQCIAEFPSFLPGLVEKARTLMVMGSWEEALDAANRVLEHESDSVGALKVMVLFLLVRECKVTNTEAQIRALTRAIDVREPRNHKLYYEEAQLIARMSQGRPSILNLALDLVNRACKLVPLTSRYMTEKGVQLMMLGNIAEAESVLAEASKLDEGNFRALHARIRCKILNGHYKLAAQELEFLQAEQPSTEAAPEMLFLEAQLVWRVERDSGKALELLNACVDAHVKVVAEVDPGFAFYAHYNPDFVLALVTEYMQHLPTEPREASEPPPVMLETITQLLDNLTQFVPSLLDAQLRLAQCFFFDNQFEFVEQALLKCTQLDPHSPEPYLLQARMSLHSGNTMAAQQGLEQALALSFAVGDRPDYVLLRAQLWLAQDEPSEAVTLLEPMVRNKGEEFKKMSVQSRMTLFLELAKAYSKLDRHAEAAKVMEEARHEFEGSSEADRAILVDAELALSRKDVRSALDLLGRVGVKSPFYTKARTRMAHIYLNEQRNPTLYAACYQALAQQSPTVQSYVLLGEACVRIGDPKRAIEAYGSALELEPQNASLHARVGEALTMLHHYARAVACFEKTLQCDPDNAKYHHRLATLLMHVGRHAEAAKVLEQAVARSSQRLEDWGAMNDTVESRLLLARVCGEEGLKQPCEVEKHMEEASSLQTLLLQKVQAGNPQRYRQEQTRASQLFFEFATFYQTHASNSQLGLSRGGEAKGRPETRNRGRALQLYQEALKHNPSHEKALLALAKLCLEEGDLEKCKQRCVQLKKIDPMNREATIMLADLLFRNNESESASYHFQQLLEKNPSEFDALEKLLVLLKRSGRLNEAEHFFTLRKQAAGTNSTEPAGLMYCRGLLHRFSNRPREAVSMFFKACKDGVWGSKAVRNMVEVYLNPDNAALFQDSTQAGGSKEYLNSANEFLKKLAWMGEEGKPSFLVLEAYALMASGDRSSIELAMKNLMTLLKENRNYVPALLALANVQLLKKNAPGARNQLKRLTKMKVVPEFTDEFERAWLLLAELYISNGKYDLAQGLVRKALSVNKSCAKAWEQLGVINEKEQAYKDAASQYEQAWKLCNHNSPAIGYKLAFNYYKAGRYIDAIDVCHAVLKEAPDYPRIQKDILQKAREQLRP